jgi:hypothetical protein
MTNERTNSAWCAHRRKKRTGKRGPEEKKIAAQISEYMRPMHGWKMEIKSESDRKGKGSKTYHMRGRGGPRFPRQGQQMAMVETTKRTSRTQMLKASGGR